MMRKKRVSIGMIILEICVALLALIVLFPLGLILINSVKTVQQVNLSMLSLPTEIHWENFTEAMRKMNYFSAFFNSIIISVVSVAGLIVVSSMASYQVVRKKCLASNIIFYGIVLLSMAIPFQALMVPLVLIAKTLNLTNKVYGLFIMYWGFLLPMAMFLYHGFIKGVPHELEEAAHIDGCGQIGTFVHIVFPILRPISATIIIINLLGVFNDFTLPLIMLTSSKTRTVPLALSVFFGNYLDQWHLIMAALTVTIIPILIFFFSMQKHIISGLTEGAIKG